MKLNYKKTLFVGFAFFLICTFWQAYDTIIPKILTDKFGMSQFASGIIMAIDNVLALFLLPLFGTLSDKHNGKRGKRTPFILVGTVLAAVLFVSLSFVDNAQLKKIEAVSTVDDEKALVTLYRSDAADDLILEKYITENGEARTEEGTVQTLFTEEEFKAIRSDDGSGNYTSCVVPLRQAYAKDATSAAPSALILFIVLLLFTLVSMGIFRSPAVALMPDVTPKPLRSKANAIINLMGAVGGIVVLGLGIVLGTGKAKNALMSYTPFFAIVAGIMLVCLIVFRLKVNEPKLVAEMEEESRALGVLEENSTQNGAKKLSRAEYLSLALILASVVLWFMGYNAVTSKYSVYAGSVLGLDYNATLIIAQAAAIVSYIPIGFVSARFGRRKTILAGILMLGTAFFFASFMREGSSIIVMDILFALAGIGWATISVNSYPMVVELSVGSNVGKYTGFYYTASMAAQTLTPMLSGLFMDSIDLKILFPYATVFVGLAFVTMFFVRHGDSKPAPSRSVLEQFDVE